jgi:hypothetical protein
MADHESYTGLKHRTQAGPADSSIFDKDKGMRCIHDDYVLQGIRFTKADKRPGSRERGYIVIRQMLKAAADRDHNSPWLLVMRSCVNTCSQIPELPIDPENPMDVNSASNDHIYDVIRYRALKMILRAGTGEVQGI